MKKILWLYLLFLPLTAFSSEQELINLAGIHYQNHEYYNSITETMRYQFLYPDGKLLPASMVIMGKSLYKGGNREKALNILMDCYAKYTDKPEGESALLYSGLIRLEVGSYFYASKNFQEYLFVYNKGKFKEDAIINLSLTYALAENYDEARDKIIEYRKIFPEGEMKNRVQELSLAIAEISSRPKKSLIVAGILSAVIPGSGYIYTEEYMLGLFSFLTNGALIYGIYDGYKKKNQFQMIFFSVIELSFYNYSIIGSIKSADDNNRAVDLKREVLIGFKTAF